MVIAKKSAQVNAQTVNNTQGGTTVVKLNANSTYLTFQFALSNYASFSAKAKSNHILRTMTNGSIINGRYGAFAQFRILSESGVKTRMVCHNGDFSKSYLIDAEAFLDEHFGGCDIEFKVDFVESAEDIIETLEDQDTIARSLHVTVELSNNNEWVSYNPNPIVYNGKSRFAARLNVVKTEFSSSSLPYGQTIKGNSILECLEEVVINEEVGHKFFFSQADDSARISKRARRKAKATLAKANRLAHEAAVATAPTTVVEEVAPPSVEVPVVDAEKEALRRENAELKAQVAELSANVASLTAMMQEFMASQSQPATSVEEVTPVVEEVVEEEVIEEVVSTPVVEEVDDEDEDFPIQAEDDGEDLEMTSIPVDEETDADDIFALLGVGAVSGGFSDFDDEE